MRRVELSYSVYNVHVHICVLTGEIHVHVHVYVYVQVDYLHVLLLKWKVYIHFSCRVCIYCMLECLVVVD